MVKHKTSLALLFVVLTIFFLGLVMVFNTSSAEVIDLALNKSTKEAVVKQILYAFLGMGLGYLAMCLGYRNLIRLSPSLLALCTFLLLLTFVPYIGRQFNGASRWIGIGAFTFQPSELAKFILPLYFISQIIKYPIGEIPFKELAKTLAITAVPLFLIFREPDNGTTAIIAVSFIVLFFLMQIPLRYWGKPMVALVLIGGVAAYQLPYVSKRIQVYLHPEKDLLGRGHQPYQAKIAAGSGGVLGRGLGKSLQKLSYLPEAQSDYIAAIYGEELGFIGILILIILYMTFTYLGISIAFLAKDLPGLYLAQIFTFLIAFQAFLNLGVVSGLLPSTGLNLPFFSQGGSSLMSNLIALALLVDVREKNGVAQR